MKKRILSILTVCMAVASIASARNDYNSEAELSTGYVAVSDTVYEDESFRLKTDSLAKLRTPSNKTGGKGLDAMKHLLERRYIANGDTFTRRWDDHLFVEAGAGVEQMIPPGHGYNFNTLTTAHLGVGKQFNKYHSLRLLLNGTFGYQQDKGKLYYRAGVNADHLFSLSSYFDGYDPSRLLDISTVVGAGVQYAKYGRNGRSGASFDVHMGLQFRFFTGPQGYVNIEPYYGLATDKRDLSENRNWRKIDMFYGANINFIYYIHNNLSPEARRRFIKNRAEGNAMANDTTLQSWQQPWFFEFSNGLDFVKSPTLGLSETMGHNFSIGVGKWLSSAIGIRFTGTSATVTWQKMVTPEKLSPTYVPPYDRDFRGYYVGLRGEALFNPLGFTRNYNWESPLGFYLFAGGEMGRLMKYQSGTNLSCNTQAYTIGANLWARLSDGLKIFVEPRYTSYIYKVPYSNVDWNKRFSDDAFSINAGFSVSTTGVSYRRANMNAASVDDDFSRIVVGVGGGMNITQTRNSYGSAGMPWNAQVYGEYHFDRVSAVRLGFEYLSIARNGLSNFTDYRMDVPESGYAPVKRNGLWNHRYFFGLVSVNYMANLTNLCGGYRPGRLFDLEAFVGPSIDMLFGENSTLDDSERLQENHECRLDNEAKMQTKFGINAGLKLTAHITPKVDLVFSPTIYAMRNFNLSGLDFTKLRHIETLNVGAQYRF